MTVSTAPSRCIKSGTIRAARLGVDLLNPDFIAFARAFDLFAERVERTEQFEPAFRAALDCGRAAMIELVMLT